jgi:hypothetical protein
LVKVLPLRPVRVQVRVLPLELLQPAVEAGSLG